MNILAIGAHPDDIEVQCAGTLARYAAAGHKVFMAVATNGNVGSPTLSREEIANVRHAEQQASCAIIGAELIWMDFDDEWLMNDRPTRTRFIDAIRQADPDVMFIHGPTDYHPDHRISGQVAEDARIPASVRLVETALPHISKIPHVFYMDNPAGVGFEPEVYVDTTEVFETKRQMLLCHQSQDSWMRAIYGEHTSITDMMTDNSKARGLAGGYAHAEGFREVKTYPRTGTFAMLPGFGV
ncbi:PIG-L deacetylase family protein [Frigidibacter sp. ROC022]|uniref:PIG-L deacetylase family protein n=1 Tax=Frigidibacter sp. ROC022 TaxID=2971796 RepID=UPI00215AE9E3|nr:PIG-L deacetylase family protein [Frigidibacter sp. ROC022]MCR8726376.1 PIG-L family deacetylase [Frigidibacter sp. ROC022]